MCQYSAVDGIPSAWHLTHLGSFANGGAGLVFAEATAVSPEGRISPSDVGIWNDRQRDAWAPITRFVHEQGGSIGIQLAHAGRKASTWHPWAEHRGTVPPEQGGWQAVAPSAVPFGALATPAALDADGIAAVVRDFTTGARRAVDAGFDVLEIHGAHGYLVHQFLSPLSNTRDDQYGGSLENRARLLLEIVRSVRAEVGEEVPLFVRLSATDYMEGGWDVEQTTTVAGWAKQAGADFFDISTGGNIAEAVVPVGPLYQVPFAEQVRKGASVPTSAVGLITTAQQAASIVEEGHADAVMIGRLALREPHFPLLAAHELGVDVDYWPRQYERARPA